jgi:hypothetical protein
MIAFYRELEEPPPPQGARNVQPFLKSLFLGNDSAESDEAVLIPAWRCGLFVFWLSAATLGCVVHALRGVW